MKKRKLLLIIFIAIIAQSVAFSQWGILKSDADSLVRKGTYHIYNIEFDSAQICFQSVIKMYPDHPAGHFLSAMVDWWKITLWREYSVYDKGFLKKIDKVIDVCDEILDTNDLDLNALFFKAGSLGYRARFYAQKEEWFKSASDGSTAYDLMIKCFKSAPNNYDIMLGTGIYNYFADVLPQKYPIIKPFMYLFPSGDKKIGLLQLLAASKKARYAAVEAKVVLLQVYYSFENDVYNTVKLAEELFQDYPNNPYFHRYLGRSYVRMGDISLFESTWRDILLKCMDKKHGYDRVTAREAMYYIGVALMRKKQFDEALKYFYKADEGARTMDKESTGFMVNTNLYIGNIYDLQGKRQLAIKQYQKLLKMKDFDGSRDKAERYIKNPYK